MVSIDFTELNLALRAVGTTAQEAIRNLEPLYNFMFNYNKNKEIIKRIVKNRTKNRKRKRRDKYVTKTLRQMRKVN